MSLLLAETVGSDRALTTSVWLGDDLATYKEARDVLGHLAVFGQTQKAGKTTSVRTLVNEAIRELGASALVFRTGRGDIPFPGARELTPFFRETIDWRSVERMLWTFLSEKTKTYRPIVMRAVHGARSLADVHRNFLDEAKRARHPWLVDRLHELDEYFREILPWLRDHRLGTELGIGPGLNAVNLEGWPLTVQQLVVTATLDRLIETTPRRRPAPLIVVLPEARAFIPDGQKTPVTRAADYFTSQGAKLNLFLWIDSQSLTGVDQQIIRNFALLLQGVQTSDLEIKRVCKAFEVKPAAVRGLKVGDFIVRTDHGVRTVHVPLVVPKEEIKVDDEERREKDARIAELEKALRDRTKQVDEMAVEMAKLQERLDRVDPLGAAGAPPTPTGKKSRPAPAPSDSEPIGGDPHIGVPGFDVGEAESERIDLHVRRETPNLTVHVREVRVEADGSSNDGRMAQLVADGFFNTQKENVHVRDEFVSRGWGVWSGGNGQERMRELLLRFAEWGFLRVSSTGKHVYYSVVPEARERIRVKRVAA